MFECPILYFTDNIVFNRNKSCWGIYEVCGYDYELLSNDMKINMLHKLARFVSGIASEVKILIIPIKQDIHTHFANLRKKLDKGDALYENSLEINKMTEYYLNENMSSTNLTNDYKTFIVVKLVNSTEIELMEDIKDAFDYFIKDPVKAINVFLNSETTDLLKSKVKHFKSLSDRFKYNQQKRLKIEEVSTSTTQWMLRRMSFRGLQKDIKLFKKSKFEDWKPHSFDLDIMNEKLIRPYAKDTINLFTGAIKQKNRYLEIHHDDGSISYQTFLAITNIPEQIEFPSNEWIYKLQMDNKRPEVAIHIKNIEYKSAIREIRLKKREIDSQFENAIESESDVPDELISAKQSTEILQTELKGGKLPLCKTSISICISSDNFEDMEERAISIKNDYEDIFFSIERPISDQFKLYLSFLPSVNYVIKDFILNITPYTVASGIFGVTNLLGDDVGMYIGTTGNKPVFLDVGLACLLNKSASATFYGGLGYGKSLNANTLGFLNFIAGGYVLIFDPKGERTHWKDFYLFKEYINVVTLSGIREYRGMLDPFNVYRDDFEEAKILALNVISELFKLHPKDEEVTALKEAFRILTESKEKVKPSMLELTKILKSFDKNDYLHIHAKKLARNLELMREGGLENLIFGNGTEETINIDQRINIIQIQNLNLPSRGTDKEQYTSEETLSCVLMMIMTSFAKKFALTKRNTFKQIIFDESWSLGKTEVGERLYEFLARTGRSLYTGCAFIGHSVLDLPSEKIKNTITYKFCFNPNGNKDEVLRMLEYVNVEATENNINMVLSLGNGECLFQDVYGRVGVLQFDTVFSDLIELFSTTPKENNQLIETNEISKRKSIEEHNQEPIEIDYIERQEHTQDDEDIIDNLFEYEKI